MTSTTKSLLLRPAYPAVPLASVLCINICFHQWLYCTEREAERVEEFAPIGACAIVFSSSSETWGLAMAHLSGLAPPILLLTRCPSLTMHHSVLLLSSSVTGRSLYCHCALFPLCVLYLSLGLTLLMFPSPPPAISSRFFSVSLCMSAHSLTFFLSCPVLSAHSVSSPYLPHEDSAPAEVDELSQPQRAGEE